MLTAAMHMHKVDSTTYASPSSPSLPPDRRHHLMSSHPPPPSATTTATLHHHLRAAAPGRGVAKRRPHPSRRQPTSYISTDPANFRRMVHQVTGADDLPPPPLSLSPTVLLQPVPAPPAGSAAGAGALMLPTLDTSAFLLGRAGPVVSRTEAAAEAPPCDGSVALVGGGAANYSNSNSSSSSGGFPTLDSWDLL